MADCSARLYIKQRSVKRESGVRGGDSNGQNIESGRRYGSRRSFGDEIDAAHICQRRCNGHGFRALMRFAYLLNNMRKEGKLMIKKVLVLFLSAMMLASGICLAQSWTDEDEDSSFWTTGITRIYVSDDDLGDGTSIVSVAADAETQVASDQMAYGLYVTMYSDDDAVFGGLNIPLKARSSYSTVLTGDCEWDVSDPEDGFFYNGPKSYVNVYVSADGTHYSAEDARVPSQNYDIVRTSA